MDEATLLDKLRRIEALFAGAKTEGEREAAASARERIRGRLRAMEAECPPVEYRFSIPDPWARKVFLALARRYDLKPYRLARQRHSTVMLRVPKRFVDETLWPEFRELSASLRAYLSEVTDRLIAEAVHRDSSEAVVVAGQLPAAQVFASPEGEEGPHAD